MYVHLFAALFQFLFSVFFTFFFFLLILIFSIKKSSPTRHGTDTQRREIDIKDSIETIDLFLHLNNVHVLFYCSYCSFHPTPALPPVADPSSIFHLPASRSYVLLLVISHWIRNKCAGGSSFLQSLPPHFLTNPLSLLFPDLVDRLWKQNCRIDQHKEIVQPNRNITPSGHQSSKVQPGTPAFVIIYNCI